MTSPGVIQSLDQGAEVAAIQPLVTGATETAAVAQTDELPLALYIGVNNQAWFFTSRRLLILKGVRQLARQLAGGRIIDFTSPLTLLRAEDVLRQTSVREEIPVAEISWLDAERIYSASAVIAFARGRRLELTVGHKRAELAPYVETLRHRFSIPLSAARVAMQRELKMWSMFCVATGSLTFLLSFAYPGLLEPTWGLTVAAMGAGAWCLSEPTMFIVLGTGMLWAAIMNLCGLNSSLLNSGRNSSHLPLGVPFQIYWALMLFAKYRKYEHLNRTPEPAASSGARFAGLAWLARWSLFIALTEIVLLSLHLTSVWRWPDSAAAMLSRGHLNLAMLGMATGLAALCSRRQERRTAVTGIVINAVTALALIILLMTKWHQP
jgi:hypothetical protein